MFFLGWLSTPGKAPAGKAPAEKEAALLRLSLVGVLSFGLGSGVSFGRGYGYG
jgi:hypothetical protein